MSFSTILVPVDGSASSHHAVQFAARLAAHLGASLELVTVLDLGQLDFYDGMYRTVEQIEDWQERLREQVLEEAIALLPTGGAPVTTTMLKGPVVKSLLARIVEAQPDLVVMGRTGKGQLERVLYGSVSRRIASLSPVPVTLVG